MPIGELRHKVDIEVPADPPVRSGSGAIVETWQPFASSVPAKIESIGGQELFSGGAFNTQQTHRIRIRGINGLTTTMRLLFGTRALDILHIDNVKERYHWMILTCKEGKSKGN